MSTSTQSSSTARNSLDQIIAPIGAMAGAAADAFTAQLEPAKDVVVDATKAIGARAGNGLRGAGQQVLRFGKATGALLRKHPVIAGAAVLTLVAGALLVRRARR